LGGGRKQKRLFLGGKWKVLEGQIKNILEMRGEKSTPRNEKQREKLMKKKVGGWTKFDYEQVIYSRKKNRSTNRFQKGKRKKMGRKDLIFRAANVQDSLNGDVYCLLDKRKSIARS